MSMRKSMVSLIISFLISSTGFAQSIQKQPNSADEGRGDNTAEKKELEKKALSLLDEILKEIQGLKLPENRIRLQANAADLLWKYNEKRARDLFKQAWNVLSDLKAETESARAFNRNKRSEFQMLPQIHENLRQEIVQMISRHDPKLARELLKSIRRPTPATVNPDNYDPELHMELSLAIEIARTDPAQALQIAEDSLEKGLQQELVAIVQLIANKDKTAAANLTAAIMKRLRAANLATDHRIASFAVMFLSAAAQTVIDDSGSDADRAGASQSQPMLDERTRRELVEMLAAAALVEARKYPTDSDDEPYLLSALRQIMPEVEKYAPARAAELNKRLSERSKPADDKANAMAAYQNMINEGDVEGVIKAAADAPSEVRETLWSQAAIAALNSGDIERARQIVSDHLGDSPQGQEILDQIDSRAVMMAAENGKVEEARLLLAKADPEERMTTLIMLAIGASGKGDKKLAAQLLEEARNVVGGQPRSAWELNTLLQVAQVYARVEPARGFEILESSIDQINTLLVAAETLDGFEYMRYFKDGELLPQQGQSLLMNTAIQCASETGMFAEADFARAKAIADKFQAVELRLMSRMSIAMALLSDNLNRGQTIMITRGYVNNLLSFYPHKR